jgi:hypothetical protein
MGTVTDNLAINTPEGQKFLAFERRAYELYWRNNSDLEIVETDKARPAKVDAFLVRDSVTESIVLTATRNFSLERLCGEFEKEWLLTYQKLVDGALIADMLCVSLYGFLYLIPDDCLLTKRLYEKGVWLAAVRPENDLPTKATCNGGVVTRPNGMIDMRGAKIIYNRGRQS